MLVMIELSHDFTNDVIARLPHLIFVCQTDGSMQYVSRLATSCYIDLSSGSKMYAITFANGEYETFHAHLCLLILAVEDENVHGKGSIFEDVSDIQNGIVE